MPSSDPAGPTPPAEPRRRGYGAPAWIVFVLAIVSVLMLLGGCVSVLYAPVLTGG
ncbi:hypothetical protein [Streptomonospora sp. PA3]|uniref:hypothetical protein n=1 Tax=Streptomonospora sp. PA3 TaxID=2607326 RepID=UPI0012DD8DA4|nr:hypothetical protein [Streptomonospora sp. PA3]